MFKRATGVGHEAPYMSITQAMPLRITAMFSTYPFCSIDGNFVLALF